MKKNTKFLASTILIFFFISQIFVNCSLGASNQSIKTAAVPSVLIYTEYADMGAGCEYEMTIEALNLTYGNFTYSTLDDYGDLNTTLLSDYDILLIPEQEVATTNQLKTVGESWNSTLSNFTNNGGVIILLDHHGGNGGTYHIFNSSGLMRIDGGVDVTYIPLTVVNSNDPLMRNINSTFIAANGAVAFDTNETVSLVEEPISSDPVVVHKKLGKGHLVLMGFDFYEYTTYTAMILSNALGLTDSSGGVPGYDLYIFGLVFILLGIASIAIKKRKIFKL
ncbi:MAG: hypothetical protein KGD63_04100 [Candidatus Lokiarchaeota archaeon]|nr:hypothetical protein [Candidatus Lokiarchaeota archaeon]